MWLEFDLLSCSFFHWQDIWWPKAPYFGRRCRCGRRKRANLWEWKDKWHSTNTRPVQGETIGFSNYDPSWTVEKNAKIDGSVKSKKQNTSNIFPILFSPCLDRRTQEQSYLQWTESVLEYLLERCVWLNPSSLLHGGNNLVTLLFIHHALFWSSAVLWSPGG